MLQILCIASMYAITTLFVGKKVTDLVECWSAMPRIQKIIDIATITAIVTVIILFGLCIVGM